MDRYAQDELEVKRPGLRVLLGGLVTTLATLAAVYYLDHHANFNVMGFYANYVIPVGALCVGVLAGSGYGIGSWLAGVKVGKSLVWMVVLLQLAAYFAAQYIEYLGWRDALPPGAAPSFWGYYDMLTQAFAFSEHGKVGQALGAWGYGLRLLETAGFACGGLFGPLVLSSKPYCERCQIYMKTKELGVAQAGPRFQKKPPKDPVKAQQEREATVEIAEKADAWLAQLSELVAAGDALVTLRHITDNAYTGPSPTKLARRMTVKLEHCRSCHTGVIVATLITFDGEHAKSHELWRTPVDEKFVSTLESIT